MVLLWFKWGFYDLIFIFFNQCLFIIVNFNLSVLTVTVTDFYIIGWGGMGVWWVGDGGSVQFGQSQNSHFLRGTLYFSSFYWQKQVKINLFERFKKILITQTCTKVFLCVFCSQFVGRTDAVKSKTKSIFSVFCNNIAQQSYLDLLNKV